VDAIRYSTAPGGRLENQDIGWVADYLARSHGAQDPVLVGRAEGGARAQRRDRGQSHSVEIRWEHAPKMCDGGGQLSGIGERGPNEPVLLPALAKPRKIHFVRPSPRQAKKQSLQVSGRQFIL